MKLSKLKNKNYLFILIGAFIFFELLYLSTGLSVVSIFTSKSLDVYAQEVFDKCASSSTFAPTCYDEEIPLLMDVLPLEDVLEVTKLIQGKDKRYLYCHVLGHYLSEIEMEKDPSKWKEVISKAPPTFCNNGFLHGAMLARFSTDIFTDDMIEGIKPDLADVCEDRPDRKFVEVEKSMCYHAIGHLAMFVSNANPDTSIEICDDVAMKDDDRDYTQTCTEGVFMQIFQPLAPEDYALIIDIAPKKREDIAEFCSQYEGEAFHACNREAWPSWRSELMTPEGVDKFCAYTSDDLGRRKCLAAVMNMVAVNLIADTRDFDGLENYCTGLSREIDRRRCFANTATRLIQIDPRFTSDAVRICTIAEKSEYEFECYRDLAFYGDFSFELDSPERKTYCGSLPEEWQENCLGENEKWE